MLGGESKRVRDLMVGVHDKRNIKHHGSQARVMLHKTLMAQQTRRESTVRGRPSI